MTHEEMAQRIGASRETVTRLLGDLKRKQLIRQDGPHAGHSQSQPIGGSGGVIFPREKVEDGSLSKPSSRVSRRERGFARILDGTLTTDLFAEVERAENFARRSVSEPASVPAGGVAAELNSDYGGKKTSKAEQFPQALGLSPADRNLGLLFIIHTQLVRALEPGDDFTDAVDVHQVGTVRAPKQIAV